LKLRGPWLHATVAQAVEVAPAERLGFDGARGGEHQKEEQFLIQKQCVLRLVRSIAV
jgi:hypothetical protein